MIDQLREAQVPFLACLLLVAGTTKAFSAGSAGSGAQATPYRRRSAVLGTACAECVLAVALMVTSLGIVRLAVVVFFATATAVVGQLARRGADEGCGCFGTLSTTPADARAVLRAGLLTLAAITCADVPKTGVAVLDTATAWSVAVLAAETALLLALSPELAEAVERTRHPVPCELRDVPLEETYAALRASVAWRHYTGLLTSPEPIEVWRELCHRFVVYPAEIDGSAVEVVFAVPLDARRSEVTAAVVWDPAEEQQHQDGDSGPQRVRSPA